LSEAIFVWGGSVQKAAPEGRTKKAWSVNRDADLLTN